MYYFLLIAAPAVINTLYTFQNFRPAMLHIWSRLPKPIVRIGGLSKPHRRIKAWLVMAFLASIPYQLNPFVSLLGITPWIAVTVVYNLPTPFLAKAGSSECSPLLERYAETLPEHQIDDFLDNCDDLDLLIEMGFKTPDLILAYNGMTRSEWAGTKQQQDECLMGDWQQCY